MTEDTRRALEVIEPMAKELSIRVSADDRFLYCNGQAIGIGCNSTYATINEFIGYAFTKVCSKGKSLEIPAELREDVERYWFSADKVKKIKEMWGMA